MGSLYFWKEDGCVLYEDARAEIFGGHNETTLDEYRERVDQACAFLEGKTKELLKELKEEMVKRAEAMDFERAPS